MVTCVSPAPVGTGAQCGLCHEQPRAPDTEPTPACPEATPVLAEDGLRIV